MHDDHNNEDGRNVADELYPDLDLSSIIVPAPEEQATETTPTTMETAPATEEVVPQSTEAKPTTVEVRESEVVTVVEAAAAIKVAGEVERQLA